MSEDVLVGHKKFHKINGRDERGNPTTPCGIENILHRVKVIKRHQAVFKDPCQNCFTD